MHVQMSLWLLREDAEEFQLIATEMDMLRPTLLRLIALEWLEKHRSRKAADALLAQVTAALAPSADGTGMASLGEENAQ